MNDYKTPGVYVRELSVLPNSVAGVSTAIPAFIGYTTQAGNNDLYYKPTRITTLKEYETLFGKAPVESITVNIKDNPSTVTVNKVPSRLMYYSMQLFFNNGGEACYIVALKEDVKDVTNPSESEKYTAAITALRLEDEPTLVVLVDGVNVKLDTDKEPSTYYAACDQVLTLCNDMKDRFAIFDVIETSAGPSGTTGDIALFRNGIGANNLKYGAAYYPYVKTTIKYQYDEESVTVITADSGTTGVKLSSLSGKTEQYNKAKKEVEMLNVTLPPSAAIAGAYASVDRDRGVWKAPANVSLTSVSGPSLKLTEGDNDGMNVDPTSGKSVNAIRSFTGKGTLVWGARTLAGNDNEWRYVPVRRLFNYVEESIQKATSFAVFEPNNAMTWLKLRTMVESFLDGLWRQGALAGGKADDAFFVQVGLGSTMTSQDILEGRLIIKVGMAAVRPAEFIVLEFTHKLQQS